MKTIGRPTEKEIDAIEGLANEMFVGDKWGLDIKCWDDGDAHLTAYCTLGTNAHPGYPLDALTHRQIIKYDRDDDLCVYMNHLRMESPRPDRYLDWRELDTERFK